jgi:hypothetical protein
LDNCEVKVFTPDAVNKRSASRTTRARSSFRDDLAIAIADLRCDGPDYARQMQQGTNPPAPEVIGRLQQWCDDLDIQIDLERLSNDVRIPMMMRSGIAGSRGGAQGRIAPCRQRWLTAASKSTLQRVAVNRGLSRPGFAARIPPLPHFVSVETGASIAGGAQSCGFPGRVARVAAA